MSKTHLIILFLLTVVVCSPLFRPGLYTSPDGQHHLVRIAWFSRYLSQGHLYPRWINELNNHFGYPIFTFVYPLPYYFASLPALLGMSLIDSLKVILLTSTLLSAVFFCLWCARLTSPAVCLAASILFLFTPYRFTNLYVRLALGEIVFLAFIPAVFWALESRRWRLAALFMAAALLSHLQLAILFLPIIVVYCLIRRLPWIRSLLIALALSAFFWLPALWLKQFTFFDSIRQFPPADHLPTLGQLIYSPWGFGFSRPGPADGMSFSLGLTNWLALIIATLLWPRLPRVSRFLVALCWLTVIAMTSSPFGLWDLPALAPIQFPWRLAVIPLLLTPVLLSAIKSRLALALLLMLSVYANRNHIRTNLPQFVGTPDPYFLQTSVTTTATPKEFLPLVYDSHSKWLFTASPVIVASTLLSALAAGTIVIWPRSRFA